MMEGGDLYLSDGHLIKADADLLRSVTSVARRVASRIVPR